MSATENTSTATNVEYVAARGSEHEAPDSPPWKSAATEALEYEATRLNETLDDSMGSDFKVFKKVQQAERSARLDKANAVDGGGWTKHTPWHWQRRVDGKLLNYWPSSWKAQYDGKMAYGEQAVRGLFAVLNVGCA